MTRAYSLHEGTHSLTTDFHDAELQRLRDSERQAYDTVEIPAWHQNNELGIIYKHPHDPVTDKVTVLVKGLGASRGVMLAFQNALTELGYPTAVYKSPRRQKVSEALQLRHLRDPLLFQQMAIHGIAKSIYGDEKVRKIRGGFRPTHFRYVGHSMGTPIAVGSAFHEMIEEPNDMFQIDDVISLGGAAQNKMGIMSHITHSAPGLAKEVVGGVSDIMDAAPGPIAADAAEHITRSLPRIGREMIHVAAFSYVMEEVAQMRDETDFQYGAMLLEDDGAFDTLKLRKSLEGKTDYFDVIPTTGEVKARHIAPNTDPGYVAPYMGVAYNALDHRSSYTAPRSA